DTVLKWIEESRLIAVVGGSTHWIQWEMQNIIKSGRLQRVLLLLPPGRRRSAARSRAEPWDNIVKSFEETPYAAALKQLRIDDVLLVQFRPDSVRVFRSINEFVQDYELALLLALYAVFQDDGSGA